MTTERGFPYFWITHLVPFLVGEAHCEWAGWFRATHKEYETMPNDFDSDAWQLEHTAMVKDRVNFLEQSGVTDIFIEAQNAFTVKGKTCNVGGKADIIMATQYERTREVLSEPPTIIRATVEDCKTGKEKKGHVLQVQLYMYLIPLAIPRFRYAALDGRVVYRNNKTVYIPASTITPEFKAIVRKQTERLVVEPFAQVPSASECRYCNITSADCPSRVDVAEYIGMTDDF